MDRIVKEALKVDFHIHSNASHFKDHDKVIYVPIKTVTQMKKDQKKSINIKTDLDKYRIFEIPGKKKRVFIECDYSILTTLEDGD